MLKMDATIMVVLQWRYRDLVVQPFMHVLVLVLQLVWLLKMVVAIVVVMQWMH